MRLCDLREAMRDTTCSIDAALLTVDQAKSGLKDIIAVKNMAATLEGRLARRVADASEWERAGFPSAEAWLAQQTGTSAATAKETLDTAKRLENLPAVNDAAEQGELSPEQTAMVADAATADPAAEQRLLDVAKHRPLSKLRDDCAITKRNADPEAEATYDRLRKARLLRFSRALDGAARLFGASSPDHMAPIKTAVERRANELFDQARREGRYERREAYLMDALADICRDYYLTSAQLGNAPPATDTQTSSNEPAAGQGRPIKRSASPAWLGLLRIDVDALRRGSIDGEELCEITGLGPISIETARRLLGDAVLKLVITRGVDVLHVTHLGRGPTVAQKIALLWQSPGCCITSCHRMAGIEHDHDTDWAQTRHTRLDELRRYCDHHHDLKTYKGWVAIRLPDGTIDMVPPEDPRSPGPPRAGPDPPTDATAEPTTLFKDDAA